MCKGGEFRFSRNDRKQNTRARREKPRPALHGYTWNARQICHLAHWVARVQKQASSNQVSGEAALVSASGKGVGID